MWVSKAENQKEVNGKGNAVEKMGLNGNVGILPREKGPKGLTALGERGQRTGPI